jgi:segregation and condensation protein B
VEAVLEAILFAAPEPVTPDKLFELFPERERAMVEEALEEVRERYREEPRRGVVVERVAGGIRLATRPDLHGALRRFFEITGRSRLSMAALETLAIVAYRQPVTGPQIQELRGVNSSGVLRTLLERRLVRIAGRKPVVGKPFLYRTTREFLMHFGLQSLEDLPPLEEFEELVGEGEGPVQGGAAG